MLTVNRHSDARAFLARAEAWLLDREIEHAMLLQSARLARARDTHYERPMYWATIEDDGNLVGCAYRTPPYKIGVTTLPAEALATLVADLASVYPGPVSGFSGAEPTVTELARAWTAARGGTWSYTANARQHLLALPASAGPAPTNGTLKIAGAADAGLAQSWGAAASIDSGIGALDGRVCLQLLGARMLYFWVDTEPRCMIGLLRETPQSIAVGIVYTPAAFRGQGHATAAMNALNSLLGERGVRNRFLYVNPASDGAQALAKKLGCRFVQDAVDIDWTA